MLVTVLEDNMCTSDTEKSMPHAENPVRSHMRVGNSLKIFLPKLNWGVSNYRGHEKMKIDI